MVGVAGGDDPRAERDGGAGEPVWVAGAVPALVAGAHEPRDGLQGGRGVEDPLADDRVLAHELRLGVGQRSGLVQDLVGDRELADVVQLGGALELVELVGVERESPAEVGGELSDLVDVLVESGGRARSAAPAARRAFRARLLRFDCALSAYMRSSASAARRSRCARRRG